MDESRGWTRARADAVLRAGFAGLISQPLPGSIVGEQVAGQRLQQVLLERASPDRPRCRASRFMPTAERSCRIVINSEARLLHVLRSVVRLRAEEAGIPSSDVDCLTVAIDEAASNIIRHAYGNRPDGRLTLDVKTFPDRIEFVLEDTGPKISSDAWRPRPLDEVRPGGLGTHFIKCFMDVISYDEDFVGGNRLRLVKHFSPAGSTNHESTGQDRK